MAETRKKSQVPAVDNVRPQTWLDPGTWTGSWKFTPAIVGLVGIVLALIYVNVYSDLTLDTTTYHDCVGTFNYTFRVNAALAQSREHSTHSWEIGYAHEAALQIYSPERSVFGPDPFPKGTVPKVGFRLDEASLYIQPKLKTSHKSLFDEEDGSVSDPASLGVATLMFAQRWDCKRFMAAATKQRDLLLNEAPRYKNGAISHRWQHPELWSDAIAMFPPFLAYYGVATNDTTPIREAVKQIGLYRDVLQIKSGKLSGLWRHIEGSLGHTDGGAWSTGNAWAAYGIARVRATIAAWPNSNATMASEIDALDAWAKEILDAAIATDSDDSGLIRNYIDNADSFGETSGTSLLASAAYRMAVLNPAVFGIDKYLIWAHNKRREVFRRVDDDGFPKPAVNPLQPQSTVAADVSPEGQSFLLLLGTAWRDSVCNGLGVAEYLEETQTTSGQDHQKLLFLGVLGDAMGAYSVRNIWGRVSKYFSAP